MACRWMTTEWPAHTHRVCAHTWSSLERGQCWTSAALMRLKALTHVQHSNSQDKQSEKQFHMCTSFFSTCQGLLLLKCYYTSQTNRNVVAVMCVKIRQSRLFLILLVPLWGLTCTALVRSYKKHEHSQWLAAGSCFSTVGCKQRAHSTVSRHV